MKQSDATALACVLGIIAIFAFVPAVMDGFISLTVAHPYLMSAVKFAVLSTFGECLGLRVATGVWNKPGFGVLPKALVWALLGVGIRAAFTIFSNGAPQILVELGLPVTPAEIKTGAFGTRVLLAFSISVTINLIFAPVFMTLHKITDMHIAATGGSMHGFFSRIDVAEVLSRINWKALWGFVFKKTLPFFWVPAHVVTFLIPGHFQVLYAAVLGIALGLILATAGRKKTGAPA